jgi:nucleoside-diphosphate-sugar epimerase
MIIGTGQLARAFISADVNETCIFASGVSNSNCINENEFFREKKLIQETIKNLGKKKIVYFSSCALSAHHYKKNQYYLHKKNMELLIKKYTNNYYIFRLPQLFGSFLPHKTLVNFLYNCIENNHNFEVFDNAYRYVIEISDVRTLVEAYFNSHDAGVTINFANPFRYRILDIVKIFEYLLNKKASYDIIKKMTSTF